jgi:hypothetical protein
MFSDVAWLKVNTTITPNTTIAPNGTLTADTLSGDGTFNAHLLAQTGGGINGVTYTHSVYAKKGSNNFIQLTGTGAIYTANNVFANFDLNNGVVGSVGAGSTATITNVGNGWYRCTMTATATATASGSALLLCLPSSATSARAEVNSLSTNVFIWGAQLVEGTDAKPYFATTNRQDVPRLDYRNADGSLNSCPRLLLEPQRTNSIRNSTMVGAVAGSPGTLPTNWATTTVGLTQTVVGAGTENGLQYIEIRYNGVASSTSLLRVIFETNTQIAASFGQTWSESVYVKRVSGTLPQGVLQIVERNSAGVALNFLMQNVTVSDTLSRVVFTSANTQATCAFVSPEFCLSLAIGTTYDFTIRIAAPQMELGAYATTFIPTTTAAVTRIADIFTRTNVYTNNFITAAGGTWFVDLSNNLSLIRDNSSGALWIGDNSTFGSVSNGFTLRHLGGTTALRVVKILSGAGTSIYTTNTDNCKIAIRWNDTTAAVFVNGSKVVTATPFTATNMEFLANMSNQVPYYFNQSALFPVPMTDAQCIEITTL